MKNLASRQGFDDSPGTLRATPRFAVLVSARQIVVLRALAALCVASLLVACKIAVEVPEGGSVVTESGVYSCGAGRVCTIDVNDVFFTETFSAVPAEGYFFRGWARKPSALCGGKLTDCALTTSGFAGSQPLLAILDSQQTFYLTPVFEEIPRIMEEDITTEGTKTVQKDGFEIAGTLVIRNPENHDQVFEDADLDVRFNEKGEVYSLTGNATVPHLLFENITTDGKVRAEVGFRTGAEINADKAIEIKLRDERRYLVLLLDESIDINIADPAKPKSSKKQKITTPASGKIIFILDPGDPMYYRYGENNLLGAFGEGFSRDGLLPFVPDLNFPGIERFDGHRYNTGKYAVGIKLVDLLQLEGELVVHNPDFTQIDFSDPFKTLGEYRAGFNGKAKLILSVAGFGLFELYVAQATAMFNADPKRGAMTMGTEIEPGNNPLPDWMPIEPGDRLTAGLKAGSNGVPVLNMGGRYRSNLPRADIEGNIKITPDSVTLSGTVVDPRITVPINITFRNNETSARVGLNVDLTDEIASQVSAEFDRAVDEVETALADLDRAIADYEFELSLRGLRQVLPGAIDGIKREINKIPELVYDEVRDRVKDEIDDRNVCTIVGCVVSSKLRNSIAASAASGAEDRAESEIRPYLNLMTELKELAQGPSDEALLDALESALRLAYSYRTFNETFSYTVGVKGLFTKTFSYTVNERILDQAFADRILEAANNVHRIPETSEFVVSGREILDQLPTEEIIERVRQEVEDGVRQVPGVSAVTYTVRGDDYQAAVEFSNGREYQVDFNVLNPSEAAQGISRLVADQLLAESR